MSNKYRTILLHYGGALLFTALAVAVRWLLDPWLGDRLPLAILYGAVAFAVWVGGYRPALLALVLGYVACDWLFISPRGQFGSHDLGNLIGVIAYVVSCSAIVGFGEAMRVARRHAEASGKQLQAEVARRREAEEDLREHEQRFRAWMDNSPAKAFIKDGEGRYIYVNSVMERRLNRPFAEWVGKTDADLFAPADAEQHRANDRLVLESGTTAEFEETLESPEGRRHYLSFKFPLVDRHGRRQVGGIALNITDRKRLEKEREELLARLDALIAHSPIGIALFDKDLRFVSLNDRAVSFGGVSREAHLGRTLPEVLPDIGPKIDALLRQVRDTGKPITEIEVTGETPAAPGQQRHWLGCYYPVLNERGQTLAFGAVALEITERKKTEAALRAVTQELRIVTDNISAPVTRCSRDLRYLWVSTPYANWFGRRAEEIVGRPIVEVMGEEAFEQLSPYFRQVLSGERVSFEQVVNFRGIGRRWIHAICTPTLDSAGMVDGWVAVVIDIHDRKQFEERLRQKNERLALLSDAAAVLLQAGEPEPMFRGLFAKIGPHLGLDIFFNSIVDEVGEALRPECCIGISEQTARSIAQTGAPHAQWIKSSGIRAYVCNPLTVDGRLLGTLFFASRSRDQFDAEELELLQTISRYVTVAYERVRLVRQLRQADRRKDEFLATLAHELRNPLAPIRNAVQILKTKGLPDHDFIWSRDLIERQVGQMARLLEDLIDISRITHNKLELRKSLAALASVLESAVETSRPLIDGGRHELTVTLPAEAVYLDADPVRLAQIFSNLLNNAAKYTETGGLIRLTAERQEQEVVVSVKDTGIGIARDMRPRLFEMFSQGRPALERSQGGLGIGLSLVKGLVEMHGGSIEARSEGPGTGSEFVVRLPIALASQAQQQPPAAQGEAARPARGKIVVADDNRDVADSLEMLLAITGYEVRIAQDGQEAVDVAASFRPDVVLLDIGMPKLNGYEAARRIRQQPWGKDMVLVALTGWGQAEDKRQALEAGFNAHMVKPVDPTTLEKLLRTVTPQNRE